MGDWALASNNNSLGEGDISSLYYSFFFLFFFTRMVNNNYKLNYLPGHDNKLSQAPHLNGFLQRFVHWPSENKEAELAGRWVRRTRVLETL